MWFDDADEDEEGDVLHNQQLLLGVEGHANHMDIHETTQGYFLH